MNMVISMEKIIILGHENPDVDSIVSGYLLEKILNKKGYNVEFIIPDEKIESNTLDICTRNGLNPIKFKKNIDLNDPNIKYILVDHNERKLAGEIICIIDHHPTSRNINIDNYYNKNISSTACYICLDNEFLLNETDLKLAVLATLVDTASFHSTKSRKQDKDWAIEICNKYKLNYDELYKEGLGLSPLEDISKASLNGLKKYNFNDKKVESSYIQIEEPQLHENEINKITVLLKERVNKEKLNAFVFIIHDMKKFKTMYHLITPEKIETKYYELYTSRGNTIMPEVEKKLIKQKRKD